MNKAAYILPLVAAVLVFVFVAGARFATKYEPYANVARAAPQKKLTQIEQAAHGWALRAGFRNVVVNCYDIDCDVASDSNGRRVYALTCVFNPFLPQFKSRCMLTRPQSTR